MSKKKQIVNCASLGIPLLEATARKVDALVKSLPKDCQYKRKGVVPGAAELVEGERADISMISCETLDRDGDVILAKGLDTEDFVKNPVVTFAHKYDELPVGRAAWVKKVSGGVKAKTIYSEATEIARACWQMTQEGILKGKSIGFLPTKIRSATPEEISRNPEWKNASCVIESGLLLEFAIATIPVNQNCLVLAVSKGIADKAMLKRLGFTWQADATSKQDEAKQIKQAFEKGCRMLGWNAILEAARARYKA